MKILFFYIILFFTLIIEEPLYAQQSTPFAPKKDPKLTPTRYEINAKRGGISNTSKEALTASREFIRLDPTYYVGHMLEGAYNHTIAADVIGFENAIDPLQKAMKLIEKDYTAKLKTRTNSPYDFLQVYQLHKDYNFIAKALYESYAYSDNYNEAWKTIRRFLKMDLQDENEMDSYNTLSWMVHRNRFYTNEKYFFLKNTVAENEKYAQALLDSAMKKIDRDEVLCKDFFSDFKKRQQTGVYHYKSILYSYAMNMPSAEYYFEAMKKNGYFPENNYANFCAMQAKWKDAEYYYKEASKIDNGDKRLKEYIYFQNMIDCYKGNPKVGLALVQSEVKQAGATPGFGWNQLAISRALLNDGQFGQAGAYARKAEEFKEVHIGTTLGQTHYDFTTNVLKLMALEQERKSISLENKKWYFSISAIWQKIVLGTQKFLQQYILINQLSTNPERENVVYQIFSGESTISFDEVWILLKDYSTDFFIKKFTAKLQEEKRPKVVKYMQLLLVKLNLKNNNYLQAQKWIDSISLTSNYDATYEKLFYYRLLEAKMQLAKQAEKPEEVKKLLAEMYCVYPQWSAYCGMPMTMNISISGIENQITKKVVANLENTNIDWRKNETGCQNVFIEFEEKSGLHLVNISVVNTNLVMSTVKQTISYTTPEECAKKLLYACFGIGDIANDIPAKKDEPAKKSV